MPYRALCGLLGAAWLVAGGGLLAMFVAYHAPGGRSEGLFSTMGPQGHYMAAFAGCAIVVWGCALIAAAWRPLEARGIGAASALGLVLCAAYRLMAFVVGDYAELGNLLRVEAGVFLVLALGFVWLRPRAPGAAS
ncbi:MAG TPA: hypothetical protein VKB65_03620 [Myxococcota bacterium]|nr:hypothetical protein [Myxococcota bacterium]